jgi:hypothetical protein
VHQRSQFRQGGIIPATPARQESGHFLLRSRGRVHHRLSQPISPKKLCMGKASLTKKAIQMSTLVARFCLCRWRQLRNQNKRNKKMNPLTPFNRERQNIL